MAFKTGTSNIEHRTLNVEVVNNGVPFGVRCSAFDVRCFFIINLLWCGGSEFAHEFVAGGFDLFPVAEDDETFVFQNGELPRAAAPLAQIVGR